MLYNSISSYYFYSIVGQSFFLSTHPLIRNRVHGKSSCCCSSQLLFCFLQTSFFFPSETPPKSPSPHGQRILLLVLLVDREKPRRRNCNKFDSYCSKQRKDRVFLRIGLPSREISTFFHPSVINIISSSSSSRGPQKEKRNIRLALCKTPTTFRPWTPRLLHSGSSVMEDIMSMHHLSSLIRHIHQSFFFSSSY